MKPHATLLLVMMLAATPPQPASAQSSSAPDLASASLEELLNVRITSAGRREQRATDAAAAVFVLTSEDIRRSGMTTVPELLRLVPGVQVARINANKWAVSVRGFSGLYSNKLLVLVDGRSVYDRLFSGVLWDASDPVLDDIERIEVIRGPGAVNWGSNAVNGIINIVTKTAAETAGALVRAGAGTFEPGDVTARYGSTVGSAAYRISRERRSRGTPSCPTARPPATPSAGRRSASAPTGRMA